jgi:hypothetical protein
VYFEGFVQGLNALYPGSVSELVGREYRTAFKPNHPTTHESRIKVALLAFVSNEHHSTQVMAEHRQVDS